MLGSPEPLRDWAPPRALVLFPRAQQASSSFCFIMPISLGLIPGKAAGTGVPAANTSSILSLQLPPSPVLYCLLVATVVTREGQKKGASAGK